MKILFVNIISIMKLVYLNCEIFITSFEVKKIFVFRKFLKFAYYFLQLCYKIIKTFQNPQLFYRRKKR